jgi:hypothetical protein
MSAISDDLGVEPDRSEYERDRFHGQTLFYAKLFGLKTSYKRLKRIYRRSAVVTISSTPSTILEKTSIEPVAKKPLPLPRSFSSSSFWNTFFQPIEAAEKIDGELERRALENKNNPNYFDFATFYDKVKETLKQSFAHLFNE